MDIDDFITKHETKLDELKKLRNDYRTTKSSERSEEIKMYMEAVQAKKDREAKKAREQEEDSDE